MRPVRRRVPPGPGRGPRPRSGPRPDATSDVSTSRPEWSDLCRSCECCKSSLADRFGHPLTARAGDSDRPRPCRRLMCTGTDRVPVLDPFTGQRRVRSSARPGSGRRSSGTGVVEDASRVHRSQGYRSDSRFESGRSHDSPRPSEDLRVRATRLGTAGTPASFESTRFESGRSLAFATRTTSTMGFEPMTVGCLPPPATRRS